MRWFFVGVWLASSVLTAQTRMLSRKSLMKQNALASGCGHLITWSQGSLIYKGELNTEQTMPIHRNFDRPPGSNYERSIKGHSALLLKYKDGGQDYINFFPKSGNGSIISEPAQFTSFEHNINYYVEKTVAVTSFKLNLDQYSVCTNDFKHKSGNFNGLTNNCTHEVIAFLNEELDIVLEEEFFSTPADLKARLEMFLEYRPELKCSEQVLVEH